jgi:hypothetical protein
VQQTFLENRIHVCGSIFGEPPLAFLAFSSRLAGFEETP